MGRCVLGSGTIEGTGRRVTWGDNRATSVIEVSEHPRDWATTVHRMLRKLHPDQIKKLIPFKYRELQAKVTG